jgi:hypothetical protein
VLIWDFSAEQELLSGTSVGVVMQLFKVKVLKIHSCFTIRVVEFMCHTMQHNSVAFRADYVDTFVCCAS